MRFDLLVLFFFFFIALPLESNVFVLIPADSDVTRRAPPIGIIDCLANLEQLRSSKKSIPFTDGLCILKLS